MHKNTNRKRKQKTSIKELNTDSVLLKGRRSCLCEASKHDLIGNCLNCGRIVCTQEGSGPCFTCGALVCTKELRKSILSGTVHEKELREKMIKEGISAECIDNVCMLKVGETAPLSSKDGDLKGIAAHFEKASAHKNKMLDYDRNASVRTRVIDDENDYYSIASQNWVSADKRKELKAKVEDLHEKKHLKNRKILIDFAGRTATDYDEPVIENLSERVAQLHEESAIVSDYQTVDAYTMIEKDENKLQLKYIPSKINDKPNCIETKNLTRPFDKMKVQDRELMLMGDDGICLTIRQPFASLLICGIKKYEGRNWYTSFRGRMWVHAAAYKPLPEEIANIQLFYRTQINDPQFPSSYPTSTLIGCVNLVDCLPQEEYSQMHPNGECVDNYVFICENPKELKIPLPMSGKVKLFKLEKTIHSVAQKSLKL